MLDLKLKDKLMEQINKTILKKICLHITDKNLETYTPLLNEAFKRYEIDTNERIACFLSQIIHESGSFRYVKEIASGKAYEGRLDLGNTQAGDGVKFKGRGLIQTTGRSNYRAVSIFLFDDLRLLDNPEILEEPKYALESACYYWKSRNLNFICDKPDDWRIMHKDKSRNKFEWLTIKINGGLNGYKDRLHYYNLARTVLLGKEITEIDKLSTPRNLESLPKA